ncbi:hypothetical protein JCM10296v2_003549 [Rhodotorula toruloides]
MRLSCGICHCAESPQCPPERIGRDFVALTDCGHLYHQSCLETWYHTSNEKGCPMRCVYLNVKRDKPGRSLNSRLQEPLPFLTIFPTYDKGDAPSSDQPAPTEEANEPARKKRKLKARAVLDDEGDEVQTESEASQDAAGIDEETRLRNQLREAMNTVREQRQALEGYRSAVNELRASASAPQQPAQSRRRAPPDDLNYYVSSEEEFSDYDYEDDWTAFARRHPYGREYDEEGKCKRCGAAHDAQDELEDLRSAVEAYEKDAETAVSAEEYARLEARLASLQTRHNELSAKYNELDNDYRTEKIAWRDEKQKLMTQLRESGDSGQEMIKELQAEVDRRDREILHINASIDGIRQVAQDQVQAAQRQVQRAETSASEARVAAKQSVREAEAKLKQEEEKRRRVEGANKRYEADLARLKKKNIAELRAKRNIVATDSDAEESPAADDPSTSLPSRQFKRTASSRSYRSPSPPSDGPAHKVNNNSKLLASPTKKRHERTPMYECEVSREYSDDEDDELEYADEETMRAAAREEQKLREMENEVPAEARARDDDNSSDVEIVESSYFASSSAKAKQKAPARPLSAHNSLSNVSSSASSARLSARQPSPFPSLVPAKTAAAPQKKQPLAKSSSDKWLPSFASSQVVQTGPKRSVKRR